MSARIFVSIFMLLWFYRSMAVEQLTPASLRATSQSWQQQWLHTDKLRVRLRCGKILCLNAAVRCPFIPLNYGFLPFQSLKRKPGQADSERSIGDYNKPVNKRLRTVERSKESLENNRQSDTQQVSDLYEHIKHGDPNYDTQTYGRWSPGSWVCDGLAGV